MPIRLKKDVDPELLRPFGFIRGKEYFGKERWCGDGSGFEYQAEWMHKFLMDKSNPGKIAYSNDEDDIPLVQISFRLGNGNYRGVPFPGDLYVDCDNPDSYHIGGSELELVLETVFTLTEAGLIEAYQAE